MHWHNSPGSTQVCYSHAFTELHRYPCDCITTSTATWILCISLHARDLPEELLPGKKIPLFLPKACFAVNKDSGNLGSLNKASDINASFLYNGVNFTLLISVLQPRIQLSQLQGRLHCSCTVAAQHACTPKWQPCLFLFFGFFWVAGGEVFLFHLFVCLFFSWGNNLVMQPLYFPN